MSLWVLSLIFLLLFSQCQAQSCGNGNIQNNEECDDGNSISGDGCSSSCLVEAGYECTGAPSVCTGMFIRITNLWLFRLICHL